jgi:hypothetical protein
LLFCAGVLLGITECNATCKDPVTDESYSCTRCDSDDQNACTDDLWYLPGWGAECTEGNRPQAEDGTDCAAGFGVCQTGSCRGVFPCTEQGILDAVAEGGGPHTFDCDGPTTVPLTGEIVIDKDLVLDGGGDVILHRSEPGSSAISITEGSTVTLKGVVVTGIYGDGGRACAGISNQGALTLIESTVSDNHAEEGACAGICADGPTTLIDSHVVGNKALESTGICGDVRLVRSSISDNYGFISGVSGSVELIESTVSDNDACGWASGPCYGGPLISGDVYAYRSTISNNYAGDWELITGEATLINSTVSGNSSDYYAIRSGLVLNSTLVAGHPPGLFPDDGTAVLLTGNGLVANSLIVNPYPSPPSSWHPASACGWGTLNSGGGNIESPEDTCGLSEPTDLSNVTEAELNLGPVGDYGGPTRTHGLLQWSVAIDHVPASMCVDENGDPLTTDQRGIARPQGAACDAGAFEVQEY